MSAARIGTDHLQQPDDLIFPFDPDDADFPAGTMQAKPETETPTTRPEAPPRLPRRMTHAEFARELSTGSALPYYEIHRLNTMALNTTEGASDGMAVARSAMSPSANACPALFHAALQLHEASVVSHLSRNTLHMTADAIRAEARRDTMAAARDLHGTSADQNQPDRIRTLRTCYPEHAAHL